MRLWRSRCMRSPSIAASRRSMPNEKCLAARPMSKPIPHSPKALPRPVGSRGELSIVKFVLFLD